MSKPNADLDELRISFFQWYCNPLEIAALRTGLLFAMFLLIAGAVAAAIDGAIGQAGLLVGICLAITLIFLRTCRQIFQTFCNGGAVFYFREGDAYYDFGVVRDKIMRFEKESVLRRKGFFGVVNLQVSGGVYNFVIPESYLRRA
jgi:hypothetical protein